MQNLFYNEEVIEEQPVYSIHLDQTADKDFDDFIKQTNYIQEGPASIVHPNYTNGDIDVYPRSKGIFMHINKSRS